MLKELIKFATKLDGLGLTKEADQIDHMVKISAWKLLDTYLEGASSLSGVTPEENLKFQINYVLDIIFESDYKFGSGGDMGDMPQSTRNVLKNYALSMALQNSFKIDDFLSKIRKMYPRIDVGADQYVFSRLREDLEEIKEMQRRYQASKSPQQTTVKAPAPAPDYKGVAERMSQKFDLAPEKGEPAASIKPQVRQKPFNPNALEEAIRNLPSSSELPEGITSTKFNKPVGLKQ